MCTRFSYRKKAYFMLQSVEIIYCNMTRRGARVLPSGRQGSMSKGARERLLRISDSYSKHLRMYKLQRLSQIYTERCQSGRMEHTANVLNLYGFRGLKNRLASKVFTSVKSLEAKAWQLLAMWRFEEAQQCFCFAKQRQKLRAGVARFCCQAKYL